MLNKDIHIYPAVFEKTNTGYSVFFPDLPGCFTVGKTLEECYMMAKEAVSLHLWGFENDNEITPIPSTIDDVQKDNKDDIVGLIEVSLFDFIANLDNRAVKKTLTIPRYLNTMAEKKKVNFSHLLQAALKEYLGIK